MANTYELIASSTVGAGGATNIEFTSIPSTYTDLALHYSLRSDRTGSVWEGVRLTPNGSATTPTSRVVYGTGSAIGSEFNNDYYGGDGATSTATSNTFASGCIYIPNYASSNNKSWSVDSVTENNGTGALAILVAGLWSVTDAITSLKLRPETTASFVQYSTAYLYGVKNA
jgi:hypothetical protein